MTKTLATKTHSINLDSLRGILKDVIGLWGFEATPKDLFELVPYTNKDTIFSKTLITINYPGGITPKGCVDAFSITKAGGVYSLCVSKANGVEYVNARVSNLFGGVAEATQLLEAESPDKQKEENSIKINNLERLKRSVAHAVTSKGKRAEASDVFRHMFNDVCLKTGHLLLPLPGGIQLKFIAIIGCIVIEVTDQHGFKQQLKKIDGLLSIIGVSDA